MLLRKKQWDILILIGSLFILTGVAIAFYLNQPPFEPRERDYVFVGSFYAFSIFIAIAIKYLLDKTWLVSKSRLTTGLVGLVIAIGLPALLLSNNYNDHDRSDRTLALDAAKSYLNSCEPNAILFTYGDNDTYPLWYIQEVEGFRKDIRVINIGLLSADWYIQQQTIAQKGSEPLQYTVPVDRYKRGDLDYIAILNRANQKMNVAEALRHVGEKTTATQLQTQGGEWLSFIPQKQLALNGDSLVSFHFNKNYLMKGEVAFLDIISSNHHQRPIYFANGTPTSAMLGLEKYLQTQGMVSKLIGSKPHLNNEELFQLLMHQIDISTPIKSWWDESCDNAWQLTRLKSASLQLADKLLTEREKEKAQALLKKYNPLQMMVVNGDYRDMLKWIQVLFDCGLNQEAKECLNRVSEISIQNFNYYIDSQQYLGDNMLVYAKEEKMFLEKLNTLAQQIGDDKMSLYIQSLIHLKL